MINAPEEQDQRRYISPRAAAKHLSITSQKMYMMINSGLIQAYLRSGTSDRYMEIEVSHLRKHFPNMPPILKKAKKLPAPKPEFFHRDIVELAGEWLFNQSFAPVFLEQRVYFGECPDVIGWKNGDSTLIECKVTYTDFSDADPKKDFRKAPETGMGRFRYFMAPVGVIPANELPPRWGLLEVTPQSQIIQVVNALDHERYCTRREIETLSYVVHKQTKLMHKQEADGGLFNGGSGI